jgi:hypothetical protein
MKKHREVLFKENIYEYEVDDLRYIWIIWVDGTRTNIGQYRPLLPSDDVEDAVRKMLQAGGY